jgi:hypothetical protein
METNLIYDYLIENIPDGRCQGGGTEFVMPSLYMDHDPKRHMSVNIDTGLWQCFKTKEKGNFAKLYAENEGISYQAAYSRITFNNIELGNLWGDPSWEPTPVGISGANLDTSNFEALSSESDMEDPLVSEALRVLYTRNLFPEYEGEYYIAREGKYKGRLVIPYVDEYGEMYFFQARALGDQFPKYLNPGREEGVKSSDILYPFSYDTDKFESVYVTEGPLDAKTLQRCGFNATCTNGSNVSMAQATQLKESGLKIVMAYDSDEAGQLGTAKFLQNRKYHQIKELYVVTPKLGEDWNSLYIRHGANIIIDTINYDTKKFNEFSVLKQKASKLFSKL